MQRRYEAHERERYVKEYRKISGSISKAEFCRKTGLAVPTFYSWCDKLSNQSDSELKNPKSLSKVMVVNDVREDSESEPTRKIRLQIQLSTGIEVNLEDAGLSEAVELIKALS